MNTVLGFQGKDRNCGYDDGYNCMGNIVKDDMGDKVIMHSNSLKNWQNIKLLSGIVVTGIGFGVAIPKAEAVVGHQCPNNAEVCIMGDSSGQIEMPLPSLAQIPPEILSIVNSNKQQMPIIQPANNTNQSNNKTVALLGNNPNIKNVEYISIADTALTEGTSKNLVDPFKVCTNKEMDLIIQSIHLGLNTSIKAGVRQVCENAFWTAAENDPLFSVKLSGYLAQKQDTEMGQMRREFDEYKNGTRVNYTPNTEKNSLIEDPSDPANTKKIQEFIKNGFDEGWNKVEQFLGNQFNKNSTKTDSTKTNSTKTGTEQEEDPWNKIGEIGNQIGGKLDEIMKTFNQLPSLLGGGIPSSSGGGMPGGGMSGMPLGSNPLNPFQQGFNPFSQIPLSPSQQHIQGIGDAMEKSIVNIQDFIDQNGKKVAQNVKDMQPKIEEAQKTIDEALSSAKEAQQALDGLENAEGNAESELKALRGILKSSIANGKLIDGYGQATTTLMQGGFNAITTRLDTIIHLDIAKLEALGAMSAQQAAAAHATQASLAQMTHNINRTSGATEQMRRQAILASMGVPSP